MTPRTLRVGLGGVSPLYAAGLAALLANQDESVRIDVREGDQEWASATCDLVVLDLSGQARLDAHHLDALWRGRVPALALVRDAHGQGRVPSTLGFRGCVDARARVSEVRAAVLTAVDAAPPVSALTLRELQVLDLIARGHTNRDISRSLFIGENTMKTDVRLAYRKIAVTTRS